MEKSGGSGRILTIAGKFSDIQDITCTMFLVEMFQICL